MFGQIMVAMVKWLSQRFVVPLVRVQFPLATPQENLPNLGGFLFTLRFFCKKSHHRIVMGKREDLFTLNPNRFFWLFRAKRLLLDWSRIFLALLDHERS